MSVCCMPTEPMRPRFLMVFSMSSSMMPSCDDMQMPSRARTADWRALDTPEATVQRMESFLSGGHREKLVVIAPPPMVPGEWVQDEELIEDSYRLAKLYEELCDRLGIHYLNSGDWNIPLAYDGVHFTQEGQEAFAQCLYNALCKGE